MMNREGKFIGHSKRQTEYLTKLDAGRPFGIQGKTLTCQGDRWPLVMAQSLGRLPKGIKHEKGD